MPELPEVETVVASLREKVTGRIIAAVEVISPRFLRSDTPEEFARQVVGRRILALGRRGKYILADLGERELIVHLMMSGRLLWFPGEREWERHTHVVLHLADGGELVYQDARGFGGLHLRPKGGVGGPPGLARLGPEPLSEAFTVEYLITALAGRRTRIKPLLLDQEVVAGLGNIYVDECLFAAGIHPARAALSLQPAEAQRLHRVIGEVLREAIAHRGTTFATYVDGAGRQGEHARHLRVFRRTGQPCPRCGQPVERIRLAGRGTHLCSRCQA
ncbi:MAG: bifunctional DNA-formamidopyrimidine glycosylase/DNA-(apurinic or apyrimidinic site) lyase [Thermaerobacter sp.]|nr:bifunctional DNA-formamidopyrimidine glycosylase/DNA-(apurinic or apyrimidinic site) lyase [Thermaerobacter sp.]MDA8145949.1 bifunctional DNA-formamidopyrimidine glycosylase/DNA-(apurinic or apyrimidinic site) lyase [Thermaerobacter sp.]